MSLGGLSETVPGDSYALFIYIPDGITFTRANATTVGSKEVPVNVELTGNLLKLTFQGQPVPVEWKVSFKSTAG